jgi:hypothetical protein
MNVQQHPLNQAATARAKRDKIDLGHNIPILDLAAYGLEITEGDEPAAMTLSEAGLPGRASNSLGLLEDEGITPEYVMTADLRELSETILDVMTPGPRREAPLQA